MKKVVVIGAGFAGISAATCLANDGFDVTVFEKNELPGGRARKMEAHGFTFDMGPSWYWMPDVFEKYFNLFDKNVSDYYELRRLDPSYRIFFGKDELLDLPATIPALCNLFESLEPGSGKQLLQFLEEGKIRYDIGIHQLVYKPGLSWLELTDMKLVSQAFKLHVFESISKYIRRFFNSPKIIKLLEFPVLFLGATADQTPALYSLMNYADMALGTWYPEGGMYKVVEGMVRLAKEKGAKFQFNSPVDKLEFGKDGISAVWSNDVCEQCDYVVAAADYQYVEQHLLPPELRKYTPSYWEKRTMAPSCLLFYIGLSRKVPNLQHHTLFFDQDFSRHAHEIYSKPQWPTSPQFYMSCTSKSDPGTAPPGAENIVILVPVAPGLKDNESIREKYFDLVMDRLEHIIGVPIRSSIIFKKSYAHKDFIADYNAFKGNAYGLANTLAQTAHLKPSIKNKKVPNLFYTGQLTVPGPGVPPAIISGQVAAKVLRQTVLSRKVQLS